MKNLSQMARVYYNLQTAQLTMRSIWIALRKQNDLNALVKWATRKQLKSVRQAYQAQLHRVEERLWHHQVRCPGLVICCELLFTAYKQIVPSHMYKRGSAAQYRLTT